MEPERTNLYEAPSLRQVTGPAIRPGGFALTGRAVELCGLRPGARVLDAGCGTGATVGHLRQTFGLRAWGVDISPTLLRAGEPNDSPPALLQASISRIPFAGASFEALFCECVLSLLADPGQALTEFARVLAPGGHLVLSDIYARGQADSLPALAQGSCLKGALPWDQVQERVAAAGFQVMHLEDHTQELRELSARLILAHGSLAAFWGGFCSSGCAADIQAGLARLKPGYYLLIAKKAG